MDHLRQRGQQAAHPQRGDAAVGLIESEPCDARPFYNELAQRGELDRILKK